MQQTSAVDCGAACLAMILTYYGRDTDPKECRDCSGVGRDGLTARAIAGCARKYGLRTRAFSVDSANLKELRLPAIVYWNNNHFVVVEVCSTSRVEIVDPAIGRRCLTEEEFKAAFSGLALTFEPGIDFEIRRQSGESSRWGHLIEVLRLRGMRPAILQILGASLLLQGCGLAAPAFTKVLVDYVLPSANAGMAATIGAGMLLLMLALAVTAYLRAMLLIDLEARLDSHMMLGFFEHMLALPYQFFQQTTTGDLLTRLGSITIVRETLTSQAISAVLDGGLVLTYFTFLFAVQPVFGAVVLGFGAVQVGLMLGTTRRTCSLMQSELSAAARSQSYLVEVLGGIATVKASGAEDGALDHWSSLFFRQLNISLERSRLSAMVAAALTMLRASAPVVLLWAGVVYVLDGRMKLGTMLALNTLGMAVLSPLATLVSACQQILMVRVHLDRIADVLRAEPEQNARGKPGAMELTGRIDLKHVHFRYDRNAPLVLRDLSFSVRPGQKIALVGRTGSGKSTLAKLLLGFYRPTHGEIDYDGVPIERLDYRALRRRFGVVLQEPFLFSGSIRHNIAFHDPNLPLERVIEAARLANLHEEILQMPMGYETFLPEGGGSLSGGQRQRLALARALARRPAFLLLDEATSHLDAETERIVDERLAALSCTRVVIAHRLSTVRNADLILVLRDGRIVESGRHDDLLENDNYYAALVRSHRHGLLLPKAGEGTDQIAPLAAQ